ncbi:NTP pyrophosphatase, house-cleaning of non-canonical NTPs [Pelagirhabdus alkalitolerans]|uniref:NTP pyrophosphatase, house-cleaning of non-canonical NTPs n=1 Tax=Pelagirhabdus alkalitolerans TaxID=1612202 RepID=A0A1G6HAT0_9BACI|nr:nucleotide pyrophosphohydrolase [Pelagirhabdus alkalitolerans]SDB91188.1 NTP pyrophosphatase, house-cleaning of non-canonical NTPs [Pelagirhabdus alkalitolerans]
MDENRDIQRMQQRVDAYISQFEEGYFSPLAMMARFTEELGELSREVNHQFGEKQKKESEKDNTIENELGDLMFVMASFANSLDIDLSEAFNQSMTKIETRDKYRFTRIDRSE